jgi:soluble lytic murein transglycosylase-like protein
MNPLVLIGSAGAALLYFLYQRTGGAGATGGGAFEPIGAVAEDMPAQVSRWRSDVREAAGAAGVPESLLLSMVLNESYGDPQAVGDGGESHGLMQLRINPDSGRSLSVEDVANNTRLSPKDPRDMTPQENLRYGAEYLALQKQRMGSWYDAIRAYLCGAQTAKESPSCGAQEASERVTDAGGERTA